VALGFYSALQTSDFGLQTSDPKQSAKAEKSNTNAKGLLGFAKKLTNFIVIKNKK
jgi:hypothetical protein